MDGGGESVRPYHKLDPKTVLHVFERQFIQQRLFHTNSFFHLLVPTHEFLLASKLWCVCCLILASVFFRLLGALCPAEFVVIFVV